MATCIQCDNPALENADFCAACEEKEFRKIGGWLWLPAIGLVISIIGNGFSIQYTLRLIIDHYAQLTGSLTGILFFELFAFIGFMALTIYVASFFFRKKRQLPRLYIVFILYGLVFAVVDFWLGYHYLSIPFNSENISSIIRHVFSACIWIPYFRVSERVKRTFVR